MQRLVWIDWMKTIGMFAIIWGHCSPDGLEPFLYSFSVPLFFLVSGYLTKNDISWPVFVKKTVVGLCVPYLILCFIYLFVYSCINNEYFTIGGLKYSIKLILLGYHSNSGNMGCGNLWFVYTLVLIKIIHQILAKNLISKLLILLSSLICCYYYNLLVANHEPWSFTNVFVALPFFEFGNIIRCDFRYLEKTIETILNLKEKRPGAFYFILIAMILMSFIIANVNATPWLWKGEYGPNILLFVLGAIWGSMIIFILSLLLNRVSIKINTWISIGTMVILCFHIDICLSILSLLHYDTMVGWMSCLVSGILSVFVLLLFIPIILLVSRYFPIILGNRNIK